MVNSFPVEDFMEFQNELQNGFQNLKEARKDIEPRGFRELHRSAVTAVEELKSKEALLIMALQNVDANLVYRYLGYNSLFSYCVKALKLSDYQAVTYISVARKAKNLPELQRAIDAGEVTVSKVSRVVSVMNEANRKTWLDLVTNSTKYEIEREVAKVNPRKLVPEKARFVTDSILELQLPISEENFKKLKRVQDLMSQGAGAHVGLEEVLQKLSEEYLNKKDPERRNKRREKRGDQGENQKRELKQKLSQTTALQSQELEDASKVENSTTQHTISNLTVALPCPGYDAAGNESEASSKNSRITQSVRDAVLARDKHQCCFKEGGIRCAETRWLHVHHIHHQQHGGGHQLNNLETLCSSHHRWWHQHLVSEALSKGGL